MTEKDLQQKPECQAKPDTCGAMTCERCAVAWDIGDTPAACTPLTFRRMRASVLSEADRIEASAGAAVKNGFRKYRDKAALQSAAELRKLAELTDRCTSDKTILDRLARSASKPNNNNEAAKAQG